VLQGAVGQQEQTEGVQTGFRDGRGSRRRRRRGGRVGFVVDIEIEAVADQAGVLVEGRAESVRGQLDLRQSQVGRKGTRRRGRRRGRRRRGGGGGRRRRGGGGVGLFCSLLEIIEKIDEVFGVEPRSTCKDRKK
jgi:hypothetical protein